MPIPFIGGIIDKGLGVVKDFTEVRKLKAQGQIEIQRVKNEGAVKVAGAKAEAAV